MKKQGIKTAATIVTLSNSIVLLVFIGKLIKDFSLDDENIAGFIGLAILDITAYCVGATYDIVKHNNRRTLASDHELGSGAASPYDYGTMSSRPLP